jgi:hypothetical protein
MNEVYRCLFSSFSFCDYFTTLSVARFCDSRCIHYGLKRILKEPGLGPIEVLSQHLPRGADKTHETLRIRIAGVQML